MNFAKKQLNGKMPCSFFTVCSSVWIFIHCYTSRVVSIH